MGSARPALQEEVGHPGGVPLPILRCNSISKEILLAAGFDRRRALQVAGEVLRVEGLDVHLHEGNKRTPEIRKRAAAAVDDGAGCGNDPAMVTHDLDLLWRAADRVAVLGEHRVLGTGTMSELSVSGQGLIREYFHGPRGRAAREQAWKQK